MEMKDLIADAENFLQVNKESSNDIEAYAESFEDIVDSYYGHRVACNLIKNLVDKIKEDANGVD